MKVTTDITKMKRVRVVTTKKDDTQYELNLEGEKDMDLLDAVKNNEPFEEIDTLRTFMLSVKIIEDAKVTGRILTPLPFPLSEYIEAYEAEYGVLSTKEEGE